MSQATSRLYRVGITFLMAYVSCATVIGTLSIVDSVVERLASSERHGFGRQMSQAWQSSHHIEICPDACFTQDHLKYRGIQILPTPEKKE